MNKGYEEHELTAFLLDELDEKRRREIGEILENSEDARRQLEELQDTVQGLCEVLALEPAVTLSAEQRRRLHAQFEKARPARTFRLRWPRSRFVRWSSGLAAAASLVVVLVLSWETAKEPALQSLAELQRPAQQVENDAAGLAQQIEDEAARRDQALKQLQARLAGSAQGETPASESILKTRAEAAKKKRGDPSAALRGYERQKRESGEAGKVTSVPAPPPGSTATSTPALKEQASAPPGASGPAAPVFRVPAAVKPAQEGESAQTPAVGNLSKSQRSPFPSPSVYTTSRVEGPVVMGVAGPMVSRAKDEAYPSFSAQRMPEEEQFNTEAYDYQADNEMTAVAKDPLSTFSIDVDTASYSNLRRFLREGRWPPPDAVRIEEMINYFPYDYEPPHDGTPFAVATEVAQAPWALDHRLVRIALKGRELPPAERPEANLVFLLDVSGSMQSPVKLPLVKEAMRLLVNRLQDKDRVAIVAYAGTSGLILPSTPGSDKQRILDAIDQLSAGGSTNGAAGIQLAYQQALASFKPNGINRVILATDGDFNVGMTNQGELVRLVQQQAARGVFLTALGFGMGNYKDSMLEKLADKGNGNYAYIDSLDEARKVLVEQAGGTLVTIAKDVKIQVEFNPLEVTAYRLIGYENRVMAHQDFDDDRKDAGEIGAGHTVTALYEVVPAGVPVDLPQGEPLKYQRTSPAAAHRGELLTVRLRYKLPNEETSRKLDVPVVDSMRTFEQASDDFRFAAAVAGFGMILRNSPFKGTATFQSIMQIADTSRQFDPQGYRAEFVRLVGEARQLEATR
ncbi:MAG: von Willebrand factor type A domain-containing protein [Acidobacteriota bacterium]